MCLTQFSCPAAAEFFGADDDDACTPLAALSNDGWTATMMFYFGLNMVGHTRTRPLWFASP